VEATKTNTRQVRIAALPRGEDFWRVDWFGDVAFPDRSIRRHQPSVFLRLSRLKDRDFQANPATLLSPTSTYSRYQRGTWVSVGTLTFLRVGDIWKNGELQATPDYEIETFTDVQIDRSTATMIKAGVNLDDTGFLLPLAEHPWHREATQSYCVMVDLPGNRRLVVPCMELIRFYFGSSSPLLTKLFLPPLQRSALYAEGSFDTRTGRLGLKLAEGMFGRSASDIGRLYSDQRAWSAAAMIGASMLRASTAGQAVYPQSWFPFEGTTTLNASGKWLSFGGNEHSTFLVYSLRSCSYPFPFKSLFYEEIASQSRRRPPPSMDTEERPRRRSGTALDLLDFVEQDASGMLAPRKLEVRTQVRFPDLLPKHVCKTRILRTTRISETTSSAANPVRDSSMGEPGSTRRVRSVDVALLMSGPEASLGSIPLFLEEVVDEAGLLCELISVKLLTESERDGWTIDVTTLCDEDGVIHKDLFLEGSDGGPIRRASVLELRHRDKRLCAVVIEASPAYIRLYPSNEGESDFWEKLRWAAQDFLQSRSEGQYGDGLYAQVRAAFGISSEADVWKHAMDDINLTS